MRTTALAIALFASACGEVVMAPPGTPDGGGGGGSGSGSGTGDGARLYQGRLEQGTPTVFGGDLFCTYRITLKQLDVQLEILPSGEVRSGRVTNLNVEEAVTNCPLPVVPPTIASYELVSALPNDVATFLVFEGAPNNMPEASLFADLYLDGTSATISLEFNRVDAPDPELSWSILELVQLTAK